METLSSQVTIGTLVSYKPNRECTRFGRVIDVISSRCRVLWTHRHFILEDGTVESVEIEKQKRTWVQISKVQVLGYVHSVPQQQETA